MVKTNAVMILLQWSSDGCNFAEVAYGCSQSGATGRSGLSGRLAFHNEEAMGSLIRASRCKFTI
eukprot:155709-Amphidinium_carterae.1